MKETVFFCIFCFFDMIFTTAYMYEKKEFHWHFEILCLFYRKRKVRNYLRIGQLFFR